jgi:hypothetical protein
LHIVTVLYIKEYSLQLIYIKNEGLVEKNRKILRSIKMTFPCRSECEKRLQALKNDYDRRYQPDLTIIAIKRALGLTNRDLAAVLHYPQSTTANKIAGFCHFTESERQKLMKFLTSEAKRQKININSIV